ncbi:hypothetical protein LXL04_029034 [Taraxacum kok-saghyz]
MASGARIFIGCRKLFTAAKSVIPKSMATDATPTTAAKRTAVKNQQRNQRRKLNPCTNTRSVERRELEEGVQHHSCDFSIPRSDSLVFGIFPIPQSSDDGIWNLRLLHNNTTALVPLLKRRWPIISIKGRQFQSLFQRASTVVPLQRATTLAELREVLIRSFLFSNIVTAPQSRVFASQPTGDRKLLSPSISSFCFTTHR